MDRQNPRACSRELDRQGQAVKGPAHLLDHPLAVDVLANCVRALFRGPASEQGDGIGQAQRCQLEDGLTGHMQGHLARHEDVHVGS